MYKPRASKRNFYICWHFLHQRSSLIQLQSAVLPRFLGGTFKNTLKAKTDWLEAVGQAQTLSRLHLLFGILDSAIVWLKSAENAVSNAFVLQRSRHSQYFATAVSTLVRLSLAATPSQRWHYQKHRTNHKRRLISWKFVVVSWSRASHVTSHIEISITVPPTKCCV